MSRHVDPQAARLLAAKVLRSVWLGYWQHKALGFALKAEHAERLPAIEDTEELREFIGSAVDDDYLRGEDFAFWCGLAGISPEAAARSIRTTKPSDFRTSQARRLENEVRRLLPGLLEERAG